MDEKMKEKLTRRILEEAPEKKLTCQKAFAIVEQLGCRPAAIGQLCNELQVKICGCQLGCF